jgi:chromosome segregation ATPase
MADNAPFSVRMEQEDKEKLLQLIQDSGKSNKEFMTSLVSVYELNKAKVEMPEIAQDIEGLQALTKQISDYYVNMGKRIETIRKTKDIEFTKETEVYKSRIETLKDENDKVNNENMELKQAYNNVSADYEEIKKQVEQLFGNLKDKTLLVEEYKQKNDTLTGLLNEYKQFKSKLEELEKLLAHAQNKNIELNNKIKENDSDIKKLSNEVTASKEHEIIAIKELNTKHSIELEGLKDKLTIEKEKEILVLQKQHQEDIEKINSKNNRTIEEYQGKYKELLEELEKFKKAPPKTTAHKNTKPLNK